MSPAERSLRAQAAANTRWAKKSKAEASAEARERQLAFYADQIDPERKLPPAERAARARNAASAEMQKLALASVRARRLRAEAIAAADLKEAT